MYFLIGGIIYLLGCVSGFLIGTSLVKWYVVHGDEVEIQNFLSTLFALNKKRMLREGKVYSRKSVIV